MLTPSEIQTMTNDALAEYITPRNGNQYYSPPFEFNVTNHDIAIAEIAHRLRTSMHWLPMTPDAMFEDGELVLCREKLFGDYLSLMYDKGSNGFDHSAARCGSSYCVRDDGYYDRTELTHYARITEPKQ